MVDQAAAGKEAGTDLGTLGVEENSHVLLLVRGGLAKAAQARAMGLVISVRKVEACLGMGMGKWSGTFNSKAFDVNFNVVVVYVVVVVVYCVYCVVGFVGVRVVVVSYIIFKRHHSIRIFAAQTNTLAQTRNNFSVIL